jgi:hypothetical protein
LQGLRLHTPHHLLHSHIGQFLTKKKIEFHTPNNMLGISGGVGGQLLKSHVLIDLLDSFIVK